MQADSRRHGLTRAVLVNSRAACFLLQTHIRDYPRPLCGLQASQRLDPK